MVGIGGFGLTDPSIFRPLLSSRQVHTRQNSVEALQQSDKKLTLNRFEWQAEKPQQCEAQKKQYSQLEMLFRSLQKSRSQIFTKAMHKQSLTQVFINNEVQSKTSAQATTVHQQTP